MISSSSALMVGAAAILAVTATATSSIAATPSGKWCGGGGGWNHVMTLNVTGKRVSGSLLVTNTSGRFPVSGTYDGTRLNLRPGAASLVGNFSGDRISGTFTWNNVGVATSYSRC